MAKRKKKAAGASEDATKLHVSKGRRPFPATTLSDALQIPIKIKELNGGNPWPPSDIAAALGMGAKAPKFFYVTAAARDFGLTTGTREAETIGIAELGKDILYAGNAEAEKAKKLEAFLRIEIFKKVLEHYKGSTLPDMKYLGNTLEREFGLAPQFHEEFAKLFRQNCDDLGITSGPPAAAEPDNSDASERPTTVLLGTPRGTAKTLKAFIVMPFVEKLPTRPLGFFAEVLRSLLTPAGVSAGFAVSTANRQGSDVIQSTIINELLDADLVIADLTDHNPNVLFELGLRMAEDKPVALVKSSDTGRIFDVDNMLRVHEYSANLWQSTIEKDLPAITDHVKAAWENRDSDQSYLKILRRGLK